MSPVRTSRGGRGATSGLWESLESALVRLTPLLVLLTMFGCVILTVKLLRPPALPFPPQVPPQPAVLVLSRDPAEGVERQVLAADSLFAFGSDRLNPDAEGPLVALAARLKSAAIRQVVVIGHTDRIGTTTANEQLSLARARAVRAALLKAGVNPGSVTAVGVGDLLPATAAGECPGSAASAATLACLAKDRRVEVWTKAG